MNDISVSQLLTWMDEKPRLLVLHVPSSESYDTGHIPGAKNVCVYEMVFLDRVKEATNNNLDFPVVVYGISDKFMASKKAATLLEQSGYTHVSRLQGGLSAWQDAGEPVERQRSDEQRIHDGVYQLDCDVSRITWTGRNLTNAHQGTIPFIEGHLEVEQGWLTRGHVVADMRSISCDDIEDANMNRMLLAHLASDDFFAVDEYETAEMHWDRVEHLDVLPGQPNMILRGGMTIRGQQEPLEVQAIQGFGADGGFFLQAHFDLDRTRWNVQYGSGKLFESLAMHLVNDHISIGLKLMATPEEIT